MNLPHPAFTFITTGAKDYSEHVSIDFSAVTTYHAFLCSLARNVLRRRYDERFHKSVTSSA
jgi:hypothetical protein